MSQTQSELSRCLNELTRVKSSHLTEDALRAQDEAYLASLPKPKPVVVTAPTPVIVPKPITPRLTKEEEAQREKWQRLVEMVTKGRVEPFKVLWEREGALLGGIDVHVPEHQATLLHLSAKAGQEQMTQVLLEDFRADPTIAFTIEDREGTDAIDSDTSDAPQPVSATSKRVAYDLARNREVRNVFRRCAGAHPDWWDWLGAGRIPSVLSVEMEEEREERKKSRRKGLKEKIRERQAKQEVAPSPPVVELVPVNTKDTTTIDGPRRLGGNAGGQDGLAGLSAEMRAKVERERRARAAEARLKNLGGGR